MTESGTGGVGEPPCDPQELNHFLIAINVCCPDDIEISQAEGYSPPVCYDPGEGDPTLRWLLGHSQARVCKLISQPNGEWAFLTNTPAVGETSVALKAGQGRKAVQDYCNIIGPVCPPLANQPLSGGVSITQGELIYNLTFNNAGQSEDVDCVNCTVTSLSLGDLKLYVNGDEGIGTVTWMHFDKGISSSASPDCTSVRTRSGGVKKVCP
jgi:hypothetical protein